MTKPAGFGVAAAFLFATGSMAFAQNVAWQRPVSTNVPAGAAISMANAGLGGLPSSPLVAVVTFDSDTGDLYQYRAMATDPISGALLWSTDLGLACETRGSDYSLVVPLADGDIVVLAQVLDPLDPGHTCIKRLRAADGEVLWSRLLAEPGASLNLYSLVPDADGQLLAAGRKAANAIALRLDAQSGSTLWEREFVSDAGTTSRVVEVAAGANDATVLHLLDQVPGGSASSASLRLVGLSTATGEPRWGHSHCPGGAFVAYQRMANDVRLRMLADSSVEYASSCMAGSEPSVELGRFNAVTGVLIWQRGLSQSNLYRAVIDADGNLLLEGTLLVDANEVGVARLGANGGGLQWSLPRPAIPQGIPPYVSNRFIAAGPYLHVLELYVEFPDYVTSATLATYAAETGQFLARHDAGLPQHELVVPRFATIRAAGDGEVLIGALSGQNRYVGSRLFETRLHGVTGQVEWSRQTPVMAMHRLAPSGTWSSGRQMIWNDRGGPGVVLAGRGINPQNYDYPRAAKVSALDGRILWRWEPDKRVRGNIAAALDDGEGNLIMAGSNGWDDPPLLLAKLDGGDGHPLWEASAAADRAALDATLDPAGNILLLQDSASGDPDLSLRVSRRSASDGALLWETPIPESWISHEDARRLAIDTQGSVFALSSFWINESVYGMQVASLRNSDGMILWRRKLPGQSEIEAAQMQILPDGHVIVATRQKSWRLDGATGSVDWQAAWPIWTTTIAADGTGQIVAGGSQSNRRAVARIIAASGQVLWLRQLPLLDPASSSETISALTIANDGNILAAGGNNSDIQGVVAMALSDGATMWQAGTTGTSSGASADQALGSGYYPVGLLQASDRNVFFSGTLDGLQQTWTVHKVTGSFADGIFASGFE